MNCSISPEKNFVRQSCEYCSSASMSFLSDAKCFPLRHFFMLVNKNKSDGATHDYKVDASINPQSLIIYLTLFAVWAQ